MDWKAKQRIERQYSRSLKDLMKQISAGIGRESDPKVIVKRLRQLSSQPAFQDYCLSLAKTFTTQLAYENAKTWRQAAWGGSRGSEIYKSIILELDSGRTGGVFMDKIRENAKYIRTLPESMAKEFTDYIQHEGMRGRRAGDIARDLITLFPERSQKGIELIARTEASKTTTALTQARAQNLGLNWYRWRTSQDGERVRTAHRLMEGVLVRWDDPPSPEKLAGVRSYGNYHAGDIFNCRCYPEPVIRVDHLTFPVKVYHGGKIQQMNRVEFERIA